MEEKIQIELPIILPCALEHDDYCTSRLLEILKLWRGVEKAHINQRDGGDFLCVHYNPELFTPSRIQHIIELAGAKVKNRYHHEILSVDRMDCLTCADVLEHSLSRMEGVLSVSVHYEAELIRIDYDSTKISLNKIEERIRLLGYRVTREETKKPWYKKHRELTLSIISGIFLALGSICQASGAEPYFSLSLLVVACGMGGYYASRDTLKTLIKGRFDIEFLMLIAAVGAAILGKWQEGALLLFLFSLGHALEHLAMDKARENITALGRITPKEALILKDGKETVVGVDKLLRGDLIMVKPGERVPADGKIVEGHSFVDQSPITGEFVPAEKGIGDEVFAGTINGNGVLKVTVTKLSHESTLSRVLQMISEASAQKSTSQKLSEKFERIFVPLILLLVLLLIAVPLALGYPLGATIYRALAILVASSPCALAIATPSAVLAGIARAAKAGVLIKGGIHLENLGKVRAIAFDKTGTITTGKPRLVLIKPEQSFTEDDLLRITASCESAIDHPLAKALLEAAIERKIPVVCPENTESITGKGISSSYEGARIMLGKPELFQGLPENISNEVRSLEGEGYTTIVVKKEDQYMGIIALQDTPRENVGKVISYLKGIDIRSTIMITGDNERSARGIAGIVGIDEVSADLLPEDKVRVISEYAERYRHIAMVGDGINDAPAMAQATVGIAMGSAGADVALETADVALMGDNLMRIPFVISLGKKVGSVILQNLVIALGVIMLLIIAVLLGLANISSAVVIHEGSTLLVVANALGILGFRDIFGV